MATYHSVPMMGGEMTEYTTIEFGYFNYDDGVFTQVVLTEEEKGYEEFYWSIKL